MAAIGYGFLALVASFGLGTFMLTSVANDENAGLLGAAFFPVPAVTAFFVGLGTLVFRLMARSTRPVALSALRASVFCLTAPFWAVATTLVSPRNPEAAPTALLIAYAGSFAIVLSLAAGVYALRAETLDGRKAAARFAQVGLGLSLCMLGLGIWTLLS